MSELYSKSSKRLGDAGDELWLWVLRSTGEEVKAGVVTGYEPNVLLERGDERTAEGVGEGMGEAREGEKSDLWFCAAILLSVPRWPPAIYGHRVHYTCLTAGNREHCRICTLPSSQSEKTFVRNPETTLHLLCWEGLSNGDPVCAACGLKRILTVSEWEVGPRRGVSKHVPRES